MRRVLALAALVALSVLVALRAARETPRAEVPPPPAAAEDEPREAPPPGFVAGTVSGRYGPMASVDVVARIEGEAAARTRTDDLGRYRLEAPSGVALEIEAVPIPEADLAPMREALTLSAGEERTLDFRLSTAGSAGVVVRGARSPLEFVAIRTEDYPPGDPPAIADLEAAPKLSATVNWVFDGREPELSCSVHGLDPDVTYRLAVLDRAWAVVAPAAFRAGDTVAARVEPALRVFVAAEDIETREPLARFRVSLTDETGTVVHAFDGVDGRLSRSLLMSGNALTLVISAAGYVDERRAAEGVHRVALQRTRPRNVLLEIAYDDGTPYDGEIEASFEALDDPDGLVKAEVSKEKSGRFRTTLPAGAWRIHVSRPHAFGDVPQVADVSVPSEGTAEAMLRYRRGGTVTFEGRVSLEREVDGEWERLLAPAGTWHDVPCGTYRVMRAEKEFARFDVAVGTTQVVREPPEPGPGEKD